MSTIKVNNLSGKGGATPNLPDGAVISGVATVTNLKPTNVNVSGAVTATTFDGSLKSTGTPTLGLGVTINSSGVNVSGVLSATTFYGSGSGLTGVGETIAPHFYDPGVYDEANIDTGIGITFNKKIVAGSGTATLKICNAGVAGTTIQSWGISSTTINVTQLTFGSLVSNLQNDAVYQFDVPEGFVKDSGGTNYVGTGYTFDTSAAIDALFSWGYNHRGQRGINAGGNQSSPIQIPGRLWTGGKGIESGYYGNDNGFVRSDGTLWVWGENEQGRLGQNNTTDYSSPVQIPGTTWKVQKEQAFGKSALIVKTDGTLWVWGDNEYGALGMNAPEASNYSSPVQLPGTTWNKTSTGRAASFGIKTDGTLWGWGSNGFGALGLNQQGNYISSPTQVPGTTWRSIDTAGAYHSTIATKTDGTLWMWGGSAHGQTGQNDQDVHRSSPTQIPGTNWVDGVTSGYTVTATKADGSLWCWGKGDTGANGQGDTTNRSSPVQVPGTWGTSRDKFARTTYGSNGSCLAINASGQLYSWGYGQSGQLGQNSLTQLNSPVQVGSLSTWTQIAGSRTGYIALINDTTP